MRAVSVEFPIPRWLRARELDGANRRSFRESPVCISPHAYPIGALGNLAVLTATQSAQAQGCVRLCEHVFVTSQGSPATRFKRAIERRSLINAELAAREMDQVSLEDALALVILYAEQAEPRFERAAVRWLGRLLLEKQLPLSLAARCVELVAELRGPSPEPAAKALTALVRN